MGIGVGVEEHEEVVAEELHLECGFVDGHGGHVETLDADEVAVGERGQVLFRAVRGQVLGGRLDRLGLGPARAFTAVGAALVALDEAGRGRLRPS